MFNRHRESGQYCLVPDFSGIALNSAPFNLMLAVGLLYIALIIFRYVSRIPDIFKTFFMKGCWILSMTFLACNEMIVCVFFSFSLFIW